MKNVKVEVREVSIPTYPVEKPEKNPFFLEKRVFQGSSGRTYPLPFYSRVSEQKVEQKWTAVYIENDFIEVMILPQIGGRIHAARDKSNGYDFIYRQDVIKPALVGLAGPWISGGIEFNWPQHHRPATYMPVAFDVEEGADGSATVWLSDHDPLQRMKGMHGVCLHPNKSYIELRVRAYNRTEYTQTFLWWANIATRVHEQYQSFFPPDVRMVADHAKRAVSTFPHCSGKYYGVDYQGRAEKGVPEHEIPEKFVPPHCGDPVGKVMYKPNDLSWYANIPVPTSYMCIGSDGDFCGGYDHRERAGIIHVANHHISPGKKQWTWGNHEFGYAWDRNLSDSEEPYIELMAGVYTDNQPDFSYLLPGETKTWSQYFYPFSGIGTPKYANKDFALNLDTSGEKITLGAAATGVYEKLKVGLYSGQECLYSAEVSFAPGKPFIAEVSPVAQVNVAALELRVEDESRVLARYSTAAGKPVNTLPETATEPPAPEDIESADELYITGLHLEQYRHATRSAELYWQEALRRDPLDSRCNCALGIKYFKWGLLSEAEVYLRKAIKRQTWRNPNPAEGEAYYYLGLTLRLLGRNEEAYAALYKATWNMAWRAPGYHALAELDCQRGDWAQAREHLEYGLKYNTDNLRARNLLVMVLKECDQTKDAEILLTQTRGLDKLDIWSRYLVGETCLADSKGIIDLAIDLARAGFYTRASELLLQTEAEPESGSDPLLLYLAAWFVEKQGDLKQAESWRQEAEVCDMSYCFPSLLEEMLALEAALQAKPDAARAVYYLGNLYYDRRRHEEALKCWQVAVEYEPENAVAWRNLGIGAYNSRNDTALALQAYAKAVALNSQDARLLYEQDLLWKRVGKTSAERLAALENASEILEKRDDLLLEYCTLLNHSGRLEETAELLYAHNFQPWEGGEGMALTLHVRLNLLRGQQALAAGEAETACTYLEQALSSPANLGEAKHLLVNQSDLYFWYGIALQKAGNEVKAEQYWHLAAETRGDFQTMEVQEFSEMTYYSALAMRQLGQEEEAVKLLTALKEFAAKLHGQRATIDYFATSLPNLLLFDEDLTARQQLRADFLKAQALYGLGQGQEALQICSDIVSRDPSNALAADFIRIIEQGK